ncbi:MAG: metal-dependent hydrolase [bacterium]
MTRITHITAGALIGGLFGGYGMLAGAVGGVLPDIDLRLFGEEKDREWHLFKHRGITHTLLFVFAVSIGSYIYLSRYDYEKLAFVIFLSLLSHIALDSLNFQEEKPFYPIKTGIYFKVLKVGTIQEYLFITLPLFLILIEVVITKYKYYI